MNWNPNYIPTVQALKDELRKELTDVSLPEVHVHEQGLWQMYEALKELAKLTGLNLEAPTESDLKHAWTFFKFTNVVKFSGNLVGSTIQPASDEEFEEAMAGIPTIDVGTPEQVVERRGGIYCTYLLYVVTKELGGNIRMNTNRV